jgi:nucleotide-binding universal stress UspA family protein
MTSEIQRLLFVVDAAVADAAELPPEVRAVIDASAELYVLTPTLPGRLAWLADDVDGCRHVADERLDVVLHHMKDIGAGVSGAEAIRGSVLTVIGDAVAQFAPDHILVALRAPEHGNWQEKRLVEHIEDRFGLPVTTYTVDEDGRTAPADGPLLLCYDGSPDAAHAIERAGVLLAGRSALVLNVWQPTAKLGSFAWAGATDSMVDFFDVDRASADVGGRVVDEGVRIARAAGLEAEGIAVEATGPVWETIVTVADGHDASAIIMGSRGLTGLRSMLLGSVSGAVVHHADRPTMVIRQPADR